MSGISERLAAASGAAGIAMLIVGGEIFNGDGPLARAGYALVVLSFVAFLVFLSFLHPILREARGPADGWPPSRSAPDSCTRASGSRRSPRGWSRSTATT